MYIHSIQQAAPAFKARFSKDRETKNILRGAVEYENFADNVFFAKEALANIKNDDVIALRNVNKGNGTVSQAFNLTTGRGIDLNPVPGIDIQSWDTIKQFNEIVSDPLCIGFYSLFQDAPVKEVCIYYDPKNSKIDPSVRRKLDEVACLTEYSRQITEKEVELEDLRVKADILSCALKNMKEYYNKQIHDTVRAWVDKF